MHEETSISGLDRVDSAWTGHRAALAARLMRPGAARLSEEQEALALGITQRLIAALAESLPLVGGHTEIWDRWERAGVPSGEALAPILLDRAEEFRWRRIEHASPPQNAVPLFAVMTNAAAIDPEMVHSINIEGEEIEGMAEIDEAYLQLRIADGARLSAHGQPLILPHELDPALRRSLLLDIAADDLAAHGDGSQRAGQMALAIDGLAPNVPMVTLDVAANGYSAALSAAGTTSEVARIAIARRDWLVVIALLAAAHRCSFSRMAAALIAARDDEICALLAVIPVPADAVSPLLDALADIPGRPIAIRSAFDSHESSETERTIADRAAQLRDRSA